MSSASGPGGGAGGAPGATGRGPEGGTVPRREKLQSNGTDVSPELAKNKRAVSTKLLYRTNSTRKLYKGSSSD